MATTMQAIDEAMPTPMNHVLVPIVGFGPGTTWFKDDLSGPLDAQLIEALKTALASWFIPGNPDKARFSSTESKVGTAIKESGVSRERLFVTTMVMPDLDGWRDVPKSLAASLERLQLDYVDMYLLNFDQYASFKDIQSAWSSLVALKASGLTKAIGVSNFDFWLRALLPFGTRTETPLLNQHEWVHPYLQDRSRLDFNMREKGIQVSFFKTFLARTVEPGIPLDTVISTIAAKYATTPLLVLVNWVNQGMIRVTVPMEMRMLGERIGTDEFDLSSEEREQITKVAIEHHIRWYGNSFNY
ncbi:NADP-dependent oxidoreductase domain-containing protein [Podospora conica]|nr:NADP-dependent oxidoreductase domain-containing protein [Schizothecium conicum]